MNSTVFTYSAILLEKNMKAKVVIGAGFGDEGKGLFTDYFSSQHDKSIVVRFNGGAQAGHTVTTPDGKRHVFSHFTSNSFLNNARGYLSKFFILNPLVFINEKKKLNNLGVQPEIAAHDYCHVTTIFDVALNQWLEMSRNNGRHGSCGLGIGETIERAEVGKIPLYLIDTYNKDVFYQKMKEIRNYFEVRINKLGLNKYLEENDFILTDNVIEKFMSDMEEMKATLKCGVNNFNDEFFKGYNIVFEGAQGLMLDQTLGAFPYVTRSNTGLKNVIELCKENNIKNLDVLYATRCYKTRHGAGPMKLELNEKPYSDIVDMTNIPNDYQGSIRFGYLDVNELLYFIEEDVQSVREEMEINQIKIHKMIGISCLDQTKKVKYYEFDEEKEISNKDFGFVLARYGYYVLESFGPTRETIE